MFHDRSSSSSRRVLSIVSRSWGGVSTLLLFLLLLSSWDAIKMWTKSVWIPGVKEEQEKEDPFHQLEKGEEGNKNSLRQKRENPPSCYCVYVCVYLLLFLYFWKLRWETGGAIFEFRSLIKYQNILRTARALKQKKWPAAAGEYKKMSS